MNISDAAFRSEEQHRLAEDEVHLWRIDLAAVARGEERWKQILSEDERERAARFHFSRDRECFTATRALLRTVLGSYAACDPKRLIFCYSDKGKPFLDQSSLHKASLSPNSGKQIEFNVSHSGTTALLAFARGRALGVDIEQVRDNLECEAVARRFFSDQEVRQLAALAPSEKPAGFFRCWTRKEAYIKAMGTGLSLPLDQFDVSLEPGALNALQATRPDAAEAGLWSLQDIAVKNGYIAALCVQGHGWRLKS